MLLYGMFVVCMGGGILCVHAPVQYSVPVSVSVVGKEVANM